MAGFGLGLATVVAAFVGLSVAFPPERQVARAPQPVIAVPSATVPDPVAAAPADASAGTDTALAPALSDTATAAAPSVPDASMPAPDSGAEPAPTAPVEIASPVTPAAPVGTDAPPAANADPSEQSAAIAQTLPPMDATRIAQAPFVAPSMTRDALPAVPALPDPAPATDAVAPVPDPAPAPVRPDPAPAQDAPVEPARPSLALPPLTDAATGPTLPGRPVTGMPGQAATRAAGATEAESVPMLVANAAGADLSTGRPLMALVLNDPGLPSDQRRALARRALPFSVALNPMDPTAAEAARLYRDAGREVFVLAAGLPEGATATDVEVTLGAYFSAIPVAAGLIDLPQGGFVRNPTLTRDIMQFLARDGYALVTFPGGLGQVARSAASVGVAHAEVFRVLDGSDESAFTIRRFLDRAVFQAVQLGQVIVFGEASNDAMLQALDLWQAEGRADQVVVVPASAILMGNAPLAR